MKVSNPPTYTLYIEKRNKNPGELHSIYRCAACECAFILKGTAVVVHLWSGSDDMDVMQNEASMKNGADAGWRNDSCCESCSPHTETTAPHTLFFHISWQTILSCLLKKATWKSQGDLDICIYLCAHCFFYTVSIWGLYLSQSNKFSFTSCIATLSQRVFKFNTCNFK